MKNQLTLRCMYATLLVTFLISVATQPCSAQYFATPVLDASNFPVMRARIMALDSVGKSYTNFAKPDFSVTDNGRSVNSSLVVWTRDTVTQPVSNIVFVLDRSGSMATIVDTATKMTRLESILKACSTFVQRFSFTPPSQIACVSFATTPKLEQDFTSSASQLLTAFAAIKAQGGTEFNSALLDSTVGAIPLLSRQIPSVRRRIVFITDGQPDHLVMTDSIARRCIEQGIELYAISINSSMNAGLGTVASKTSGKNFEIHTQSDLEYVLSLLMAEWSAKQVTYLEWLSPISCTEASRTRLIETQFRRPTIPLTRSQPFVAPPNSVASLEMSPKIVSFGEVAPSASRQRTVHISAVNSSFVISSLSIAPLGFYTIVEPAAKHAGDTVKAGESWDLTLQFTQGAVRTIHEAKLTVYGGPCPNSVDLIGGDPLTLIKPNGNDLFSSCDSILIRWAGVDASQPVNIFYTTEGSSSNPTWKLIVSGATGLQYVWKSPVDGANVRLRVSAAFPAGYQWTQSLGGSSTDTARSISLDATQQNVVIAGSFSDTLFAGATTAISNGSRDIVVARYRIDGTPSWIRTYGGADYDVATAVTQDAAHDVYFCGTFTSSSMQQGTGLVQRGALDISNMFVTCLDSSGTVSWSNRGGGTSTTSGFATADSIAFENDSVYVYGQFRDRLRIDGYSSAPGFLELNRSVVPPTLFPYVATFDKQGHITSLINAYVSHSYSSNKVVDSKSNVYDVGGYKGIQDNGSASLNLTSRGDYDVYLRKYGAARTLETMSENDFSIITASVDFSSSELKCADTRVLESSDTAAQQLIVNNKTIPFLISNCFVTGVDASDFALVSSLKNKVVFPGDSVTVQMRFHPTAPGKRSALLVVQNSCASDTIPVVGNGIATTDVRDSDTGVASIYPIPASGLLHVQFADGHPTIRNLRVSNLLGEELFSTMVLSGQPQDNVTIDLSSVRETIVVLRVQTEGGERSYLIPFMR